MRIHHLNCGSLCPPGGRLFSGAGGLLSPAPICCHCLLIEGNDRLILVDTGLGVEDVNEPRRLGHLFNPIMRPRLEVAETALRQVVDLGFRPSDVRHIVPTHLDLDHAGGISDFPGAAVHVHADELRAASSRPSLIERSRYRAVQISAVKKWAVVEEEGEILVRLLGGARDPRNERRGPPGPAARPHARTLRRGGTEVGGLAAPLRRCLFAPFPGRAGRRRGAAGLAGVRKLDERRRRGAARQSGPATRARAADDWRRQAVLLARSGRVRGAEGRGRTQAETDPQPVRAPAPRRAQYRDVRAAE